MSQKAPVFLQVLHSGELHILFGNSECLRQVKGEIVLVYSSCSLMLGWQGLQDFHVPARATGSRMMKLLASKLLASKQSACLIGVFTSLDQSTLFGTENAELMRQQPKFKITGSSSELGITCVQLKSRKSTIDRYKASVEHAVLTCH